MARYDPDDPKSEIPEEEAEKTYKRVVPLLLVVIVLAVVGLLVLILLVLFGILPPSVS